MTEYEPTQAQVKAATIAIRKAEVGLMSNDRNLICEELAKVALTAAAQIDDDKDQPDLESILEDVAADHKIAAQDFAASNAALDADIIREIDRVLGHIEGINDERDAVPILLQLRRRWPIVTAALAKDRVATIERCAQVAENCKGYAGGIQGSQLRRIIAAAIRKLKDQP